MISSKTITFAFAALASVNGLRSESRLRVEAQTQDRHRGLRRITEESLIAQAEKWAAERAAENEASVPDLPYYDPNYPGCDNPWDYENCETAEKAT